MLPEESPETLPFPRFWGPDEDRDPARDLKRKPADLPKPLRPAERDALLAQAEAEIAKATNKRRLASALRDRLIVQCGLFLGVRVTELVKLRVEHFDLARASVTVYQGKGGKDRVVPIHSRLLATLRDWIGKQTQGWLFYGEGGYHLSQRGVQERLKRLAQAMGFTRIKLRPHCLRHTAATMMLERGSTVREVQEFLGHSSIRTTQVYLAVDPERLRAAVERL